MTESEVLLFSGSCFYPSGGWEDFKGYFENIGSAQNWLSEIEPDALYMWAHIVHKDNIVLYASGPREYDDANEWVWRDEE